MHLAELRVENFRLFGSLEDSKHLDLALNSSLTALVGENDSGKSAVVDAIRLVLGTTASDATRVRLEDFNVPMPGAERVLELKIRCKFRFKDKPEAAPFAEFLTIESGDPVLYVTLQAKRPKEGTETVGLRRGIVVNIQTGADGDGPRLDGLTRNLLTTTFLKPLRDAINELAAGKRSRLTQILSNVEGYAAETESDFKPEAITENKVSIPATLSGILKLSQFAINNNRLVQQAQQNLNSDLLSELSLATAPLRGAIGIANSGDLKEILEKLELFLGTGVERVSRGLGSNNVLFMAAELLLLRSADDFGLPLLIIEEPEAHLHPQWQLTVAEFLRRATEEQDFPLQVILTTHSPTLASHLKLKTLILMQQGRPFPLAPGHTQLKDGDYRFLERFLDATRANLFFARGVIIVEGDAENILLPVLAEILGYPLAKYGVSIVNVGHVGLFRYARIFQRSAEPQIAGIRVACVADLDPKENDTDETLARKRERIAKRVRGGIVDCFVADQKTFEYDLAYYGLARQVFVSGRLAGGAGEDELAAANEAETAANLEFDNALSHLSTKDQAAMAFDSILHGGSKPAAAHYCADLLARSFAAGEIDRDWLEGHLPPYILRALHYVTRP